MKISEADILIVPGWSSSGEDHWQSRWQRSIKTARRVEQDDWYRPDREAWTGRLIETVASCVRPVILVAHSMGVATVVHAAAKLGRMPGNPVVAAFLVAPADVDNARDWPVTEGYTFDETGAGFAPLPLARLPFEASLVASSDDPYCSSGRARQLATAWGAKLVEIQGAGHINTASGHGPWPEGLLHLGGLLNRLSAGTRH